MSARRVLIIDDEEDIREVARISLEMVGGWHVLAASSAQEGLAAADREKPDVILLDVMMPHLDGPGTFQKLRANPATCEIPVILMTAKVQAADQRRFQELGVTGVLAKPFDPMKLPAQIAAILGWHL